jgi:hypothetical protein
LGFVTVGQNDVSYLVDHRSSDCLIALELENGTYVSHPKLLIETITLLAICYHASNYWFVIIDKKKGRK